MRNAQRRSRCSARLVALAAAVTLAACGGGGADESSSGEAEESSGGGAPATVDGREIFTQRCATCHSLADADATGRVGPALDDTDLDVAAIEDQVRNGGGQMPAFEEDLSDEQITAVSEYVAEASR